MGQNGYDIDDHYVSDEEWLYLLDKESKKKEVK